MSNKKKAKRKKSPPKAKAHPKRRNAKTVARRRSGSPAGVSWVGGALSAKAVKARAVVNRKRIGTELGALLASAASLEAAVAPAAAAAIPIDFELKVANPASNIAPAIRVVVGSVSTDVPLQTSDQEAWFGGISAAAGTQLQIFASARVKTDGSMTLSVKEPGFTFPPIKTDPVDGLCAIGPLPYQVG
jgi:hypothetical protein